MGDKKKDTKNISNIVQKHRMAISNQRRQLQTEWMGLYRENLEN